MKKVFLLLVLLLGFSTAYAQYYHLNKANKYLKSGWDDSAFSEYKKGMNAGETSCALGVAWCYLNECGTPRNVKKAISILEQYAEKDVAICLFVALFYDPTNCIGNVYWGYEYHPVGEVVPIESIGYGIRTIYGFWPDKASRYGLSPDLSKAIRYAEKVNKKLKSTGPLNYVNSLKQFESEN